MSFPFHTRHTAASPEREELDRVVHKRCTLVQQEHKPGIPAQELDMLPDTLVQQQQALDKQVRRQQEPESLLW